MSAFCQGFTSLSEIEQHTFVLVIILIKLQTTVHYSCGVAHFLYPTRNISFPGPPRATAYLCMARDTLTVLRTKDIWHIFCFSCPFMSFEARRKSQYAKLVQTTSIFFVTNFQLWSGCQHFLIEWPSFVTISFGPCRYFLAHVACRNLP